MQRVPEAGDNVEDGLDVLGIVEELDPLDADDEALSEPELHAVARSAMAKMATERTR